MANETLRFALAQVPGLKPGERLLLAEVFNPSRNIGTLSKSEVESVINRPFKGNWIPDEWEAAGRRIMTVCVNSGIGYLPFSSPDYPPQLKEIYDPPDILYYRGELPNYEKPMIGMVGTRYPTGSGRRAAFGMGLAAGSEGLGVVSGLARGIDLSSHEGNIAGGGRTAAVLACGLDRIYPRMNVGTAHEILKSGGCLFSEYPPGTKPQKYHFPARNRIISGLSRGVVIVEAPAGSGALITADYAAEQGRDLFVHQANMTSPCGEGGRRLANDGAPIIENIEEVLVEWWGNSLSYEEDVMFSREKYAGKRSALMLEKELEGEIIQFQGDYFRRRR